MKLQVLMLSLIAVLLVLAIPAKAAEISRYEITFDIQPSGEVKESIHVVFSQEVNESYFTYMFAGDISGLRITDGQKDIQYTIENTGEGNNVRLAVPSGTKEIYISFSSRDLVFWNGNIMQFFTNFRPPAGLQRADITVILPQGFSVYRDMCSPGTPNKATDGTRISLSWHIENPGEDVPISAKIYNPYQSADFLLLPAIVAVFAVGFVWLFFRNRKKSQQAFLRGFTEDERKVVEAMRQRKSCYQNRLVKELGFSKAKMSRITQKLEKKGLIEREKAGRNKRIDWKG
ncbi:MAG: MarR family transcriptional regulator [Candidatus Aenigmarchaeota archaeon]|nr:MarR family transcriptional regulator [Candidatus Aenigmarchaeota archaeon]